MAAKENKLCEQVIGIGRNRLSLDEAKRLEAIDEGFTDLKAGIESADLIVLCTPVRHIVSVLSEVYAHCKPGAIITDVGSTKERIVRTGEAGAASANAFFVGSHPMAGSEKTGVRHSRADLYAGATCFVTKTEKTDMKALVRLCSFWRALESRVVLVRPERHDYLVAMISHLPHLMAVALVQAVEASKEDKNLIKGIIGNGFRDTTRIACGSPEMWDDIFSDNCERLAELRGNVEHAISEVISGCKGGPGGLKDLLQSACEYREFLSR